MNHKPALVAMLSVEGNRNGEKQRTLKDILLISAWVAGYAGVLMVFRFASAMEILFSQAIRRWNHAAETSVAARDRADVASYEESPTSSNQG
jgi:cytochrome c biogenesis protein CcdA